jgi:hypothetical protein
MGNFLCFNCSEKSGKQNNLIANRNYFYINDINITLNNFIKLYEIGKGGFGIVKLNIYHKIYKLYFIVGVES